MLFLLHPNNRMLMEFITILFYPTQIEECRTDLIRAGAGCFHALRHGHYVIRKETENLFFSFL